MSLIFWTVVGGCSMYSTSRGGKGSMKLDGIQHREGEGSQGNKIFKRASKMYGHKVKIVRLSDNSSFVKYSVAIHSSTVSQKQFINIIIQVKKDPLTF